MVRPSAIPYSLHVEPLAVSRITRQVIVASAAAREAAPDRTHSAYVLGLSSLLPAIQRAVTRTHTPEDWTPHAADVDGWARIGAYLGALDGRANAPQRGRAGANEESAFAYLCAYGCAYMAAKWQADVARADAESARLAAAKEAS